MPRILAFIAGLYLLQRKRCQLGRITSHLRSLNTQEIIHLQPNCKNVVKFRPIPNTLLSRAMLSSSPTPSAQNDGLYPYVILCNHKQQHAFNFSWRKRTSLAQNFSNVSQLIVTNRWPASSPEPSPCLPLKASA